MKPAITSEQWFRYSDTRFSPVRKAAQRVPRHSTGLASLLLFVLIVLVMYICKKGQTKNKKGFHQKCIFPTWTNPKSGRMRQTPWSIKKKKNKKNWEEVSGNSENNFRSTNPVLLNDVKYPLAFTHWTFSEQLCTGSALLILCKSQLVWWQTRTLNAHDWVFAERLRNSCLYSCRNCNVQKMECLESVWTNCSSFLGSVKFKEQRTLRETIPAISPTRWKETHSMRGFFQNKRDFENVIPSMKFHCPPNIFLMNPTCFWQFVGNFFNTFWQTVKMYGSQLATCHWCHKITKRSKLSLMAKKFIKMLFSQQVCNPAWFPKLW